MGSSGSCGPVRGRLPLRSPVVLPRIAEARSPRLALRPFLPRQFQEGSALQNRLRPRPPPSATCLIWRTTTSSHGLLRSPLENGGAEKLTERQAESSEKPVSTTSIPDCQ